MGNYVLPTQPILGKLWVFLLDEAVDLSQGGPFVRLCENIELK